MPDINRCIPRICLPDRFAYNRERFAVAPLLPLGHIFHALAMAC